MKKEIALSTKSFPQNWKIFESTENTHPSPPLPPPLQKKAFNFFQAPMLLLTYFSQNFTSDEFNTGCDLEADHINTVDRIFSTLKLG